MKKLVLFATAIVFILLNFNTMAQTPIYEPLWKKVDSLDMEGLPKSALAVVDQIYTHAKGESNYDQILKAFIHRMKFRNAMEEYAFEDMISELKAEIDSAPFPNSAIMHSMLAEMYYWYYTNNRWKFMQRSETAGAPGTDIRTWDLNTLTAHVIKHYLLSLERKTDLQQTDLRTQYDELINWGTHPRTVRPTLYDFLAHRAINFFRDNSISVTRPADRFLMRDAIYFAPADEFARATIESNDTLSTHFHAIKIFQEVLGFRSAASNLNTTAFIFANLQRLDFVYKNSINDSKDSLYLKRLQQMESRFAGNEYAPEISYRIAEFYYNRSQKYDPKNPLTTKYKWDKKTALEICNKVIEATPESTGADKCKSLVVRIQQHNLGFQTENYALPNQSFPLQLTVRNTSKVWLRVASISREKLQEIAEDNYGKDYYDKAFSASDEVYRRAFELPDDGDFNQKTLELPVDNLPIGFYMITVANNADFSYEENMTAYDFVTVTNLSYVERKNSDGSYDIYVLNRKTGAPMPGVTVQTWYSEYKSLRREYVRIDDKKFTTDENGYVKIPENRDQTLNADFSIGNDFITSASRFYAYRNRSEEEAYKQAYLFTDRAIYRPGQTVYFKGILVQHKGEEHEIVSNHRCEVTFYDVNHQEIGRQVLQTNDYGSFSGTFQLPTGRINGQMRINTPYGSKSFRVEEYKRPKFEVEIQPLQGNAVLNDTVVVRGEALAYAGPKITDAKVTYRVQRTPRWIGWRWYNWNMPEVEIANGTLTTNENGEFEIRFVAQPDWSLPQSPNMTFSYKVSVDVTDINGETRSDSRSVSVGYVALQVRAQLPDMLSRADTSAVPLVSQNLNGQFLPAKGQLTVYRLQEPQELLQKRQWEMPDTFIYNETEWKTELPGYEYRNETDYTNWAVAETVQEQDFNTNDSKTFRFKQLKKWETGVYKIVLTSEDAFGNPIENTQFFTVYDPLGEALPYKQYDWFQPLVSSGEPGQNAEFLIGSAAENVSVLYEIEHNNAIVHSEWLTLNNEQRRIQIPIEEKHRGNFAVHFLFVKDNHSYLHQQIIRVPYTNKTLDISFGTFRNKLYPGEEEEWHIKISGHKGQKVAAEMLATLYDASLDQFARNYWQFDIYNSRYAQLGWSARPFSLTTASLLKYGLDRSHYPKTFSFDYLNWFGFSYYSYSGIHLMYSRRSGAVRESAYVASPVEEEREEAPAPMADSIDDVATVATGVISDGEQDEEVQTSDSADKDDVDLSAVKARTNFNETAFFFPTIETNAEGDLYIKFQIPEALTEWRMMGLAHTKQLEYGMIENSLITQKDLMVMPNPPRFFRQNDKMIFTAKVSNVSENELSGKAELQFFNPLNMQPVEGVVKGRNQQRFTVAAGGNALVAWDIEIPENVSALSYRIVAAAGDFSDGEEKVIPVLTNRMLVTESLPLPVRSNETKTFTFDKLLNSGTSSTLRHESLTLEYTSNPAWYAVQALPYLMEYPYECAEQVFSRYYANSLASHIANSSPKIKAVFDAWRNTPDSEALLSNLEKNQELKSVLLQETPWVLNAQDENERKKRVALLFDLNRMANELDAALTKLQRMQLANGGFPWFDGMPDSRYITQHIVTGMGHLKHLNVININENNLNRMLSKAMTYMDERIEEDYRYLKQHYTEEELEENHLSYAAIQYLYAHSFFDFDVKNSARDAYDYYYSQAQEYWLSQNKYAQGMIALALHRNGDSEVPGKIVKSLREHAIVDEEMGMYWKDNTGGYYWYQAPIETQALMVEVFHEVAADRQAVDDLRVWLLKQKQTQDWKTTKATVEAVYALLLEGTDWLATEPNVVIEVGEEIIDPNQMPDMQVEAGTGYFKTTWHGSEIQADMGNVTVTKTGEGVSWGALYWQYFEQLDKITPHETPLQLSKQLFVERLTDRGEIIELVNEDTELKTGDRIIVRIELKVDRALEYVHMKDMRAAGFEPENVISRYKYQDGLGYYETTKDASTNFFIGYMPKGVYVFEYPLRVTHQGDFSNGITTIQCMYAPEFTSHSEGIRVEVKE